MFERFWPKEDTVSRPPVDPIRPRKPRVLSDASYVEIAHRRRSLECELRARLYFYDETKFIVCSASGISESGEPTVLPPDVSDDDLGRCVCDHLLSFNPKSPENMREHKMRDWPAYKASGAKSIRAFQERTWRMMLTTSNTTIMIDAAPVNTLWREITAHGTSLPRHDNVGRVIRRTLRGAMVLRENGVI
jgi:hypothetical protein